MNVPSPVAEDDFNALLELLDKDTMRDVVGIFIASAPERLASARRGLAAGDGTIAATAFHAMRSGCGQLGARRLEEMCATGERLSRHGDLAGASERLAAAAEEFEHCRTWFRTNGWLNA